MTMMDFFAGVGAGVLLTVMVVIVAVCLVYGISALYDFMKKYHGNR